MTKPSSYIALLKNTLDRLPNDKIDALYIRLVQAYNTRSQIFLIGNGGSAANASHIANDFLYGVTKKYGKALRVNSLTSNSSVLTCLGNDVGYDNVFDYQLAVLGSAGDTLIVLSGSGNSKNLLETVIRARERGIYTVGIIGYDGGRLMDLVDLAIHTPVHDMQISEDIQLIISHMLMQRMYQQFSEIVDN